MGVMFFWVVTAVMVVVLSVLIRRSMQALETEAREALNSVRIANNLIGKAGGQSERAHRHLAAVNSLRTRAFVIRWLRRGLLRRRTR